jgi:hypothetical protein
MAILTFFGCVALFYEEAYTNAPGDVVERRHSTNVTVRVSASGGPHGGVFTLTRTGFDKLSFVEGDPLPEEIITLAPNETRSWRAEYAPRVHSDRKNDVTLSARFEEHLTANTLSSEDKMTVVKLKLTPEVERFGCENRHIVGVGESIICFSIPAIGQFKELGGGRFELEKYYVAPLTQENSTLFYEVNDLQYVFRLLVIEPSAIVARNPKACDYGVEENIAGGVGMECEIYILPEIVSFNGIAMEEIPSSEGLHSGYFSNLFFTNVWYHTVERGAGHWVNIGRDNSWGCDLATMGDRLPFEKSNGDMTWNLGEGSLSDGMIVWYINWGWGDRNAEPGDLPICSLVTRYDQTFTIDSEGTLSILKFDHIISRGTNNVRRLNGRIVD